MKPIQILIGANLFIAAIATHAQPVTGEPPVGSAVAAFEMIYSQRSAEEVGRRAQLLAQIFTGKALRLNASVAALVRPADANWHAPFDEMPQLLMRYLPAFDELRLLDAAA